MQRRFAFSLVAAVALAALSGSRVGMAVETPAAGTVSTLAGIGPAGFSGDGGPATQARLSLPWGVVVDPAGNVFIAELDNSRVRKVSPDGMISTVARMGAAESLALDQAGNLFISSHMGHRVHKLSPQGLITTVAGSGKAGFSGDGGPALQATFDWAGGIAVDAVGNLFIVDVNNHRVRKVGPDGIISTVAGSGPSGFGRGESTGDGGLATDARLMGPLALTLDRSGNLYIAEHDSPLGRGGFRVRKVSPDGIITTVAGSDASGFSGDGGPATQARLSVPLGVAVDTEGNLFIADWNNHRIRKVDGSGIISTVAGNGKTRYAGDGVAATATGLEAPFGLAVDAVGNLLIADADDGHRVLKLFGVAAPGLISGEPFPSP
jgi:trimeric autotransporter adhesin